MVADVDGYVTGGEGVRLYISDINKIREIFPFDPYVLP
jgi:hypothetical protein